MSLSWSVYSIEKKCLRTIPKLLLADLLTLSDSEVEKTLAELLKVRNRYACDKHVTSYFVFSNRRL